LTIDVDTLCGTRIGKHILAALTVTQRWEATISFTVLIRKNKWMEGSHSGVWEITAKKGGEHFPFH